MSQSLKFDDGGTRLLSKGAPLRSKVFPESFYRAIDAGVRFPVRVLHAYGFDTCQSCQGGKGHAYDQPTIEMESTGDDAGGFGALAALQRYGLPVADIAIRWPVRNGLPYERLWTITFRKTMEDRADEKPVFVYSYSAQ
jgi:hypothetical protein